MDGRQAIEPHDDRGSCCRTANYQAPGLEDADHASLGRPDEGSAMQWGRRPEQLLLPLGGAV
jgi:hypothetical protein